MKNNLKSPCKECPFKKNSLAGYLGGVWTANELHKFVMAEREFPCHVSMENNDEENYSHCVGSILYMNKNAKRCINPTLRKLQENFKSEDNRNILNLKEFHEHHNKFDK